MARGYNPPLPLGEGEGCTLSRYEEKQWQQASGLLALMQLTCILPGITSYSAVISACEKDQHWQQALGLLDTRQQTRALPGVIPTAVIIAREKGQRWQQALGFLALLQQTAILPNVLSLSRHQCL